MYGRHFQGNEYEDDDDFLLTPRSRDRFGQGFSQYPQHGSNQPGPRPQGHRSRSYDSYHSQQESRNRPPKPHNRFFYERSHNPQSQNSNYFNDAHNWESQDTHYSQRSSFKNPSFHQRRQEFASDHRGRQHVPQQGFAPGQPGRQHVPQQEFAPDHRGRQHIPQQEFAPDHPKRQHVPQHRRPNKPDFRVPEDPSTFGRGNWLNTSPDKSRRGPPPASFKRDKYRLSNEVKHSKYRSSSTHKNCNEEPVHQRNIEVHIKYSEHRKGTSATSTSSKLEPVNGLKDKFKKPDSSLSSDENVSESAKYNHGDVKVKEKEKNLMEREKQPIKNKHERKKSGDFSLCSGIEPGISDEKNESGKIKAAGSSVDKEMLTAKHRDCVENNKSKSSKHFRAKSDDQSKSKTTCNAEKMSVSEKSEKYKNDKNNSMGSCKKHKMRHIESAGRSKPQEKESVSINTNCGEQISDKSHVKHKRKASVDTSACNDVETDKTKLKIEVSKPKASGKYVDKEKISAINKDNVENSILKTSKHKKGKSEGRSKSKKTCSLENTATEKAKALRSERQPSIEMPTFDFAANIFKTSNEKIPPKGHRKDSITSASICNKQAATEDSEKMGKENRISSAGSVSSDSNSDLDHFKNILTKVHDSRWKTKQYKRSSTCSRRSSTNTDSSQSVSLFSLRTEPKVLSDKVFRKYGIRNVDYMNKQLYYKGIKIKQPLIMIRREDIRNIIKYKKKRRLIQSKPKKIKFRRIKSTDSISPSSESETKNRDISCNSAVDNTVPMPDVIHSIKAKQQKSHRIKPGLHDSQVVREKKSDKDKGHLSHEGPFSVAQNGKSSTASSVEDEVVKVKKKKATRMLLDRDLETENNIQTGTGIRSSGVTQSDSDSVDLLSSENSKIRRLPSKIKGSNRHRSPVFHRKHAKPQVESEFKGKEIIHSLSASDMSQQNIKNDIDRNAIIKETESDDSESDTSSLSVNKNDKQNVAQVSKPCRIELIRIDDEMHQPNIQTDIKVKTENTIEKTVEDITEIPETQMSPTSSALSDDLPSLKVIKDDKTVCSKHSVSEEETQKYSYDMTMNDLEDECQTENIHLPLNHPTVEDKHQECKVSSTIKTGKENHLDSAASDVEQPIPQRQNTLKQLLSPEDKIKQRFKRFKTKFEDYQKRQKRERKPNSKLHSKKKIKRRDPFSIHDTGDEGDIESFSENDDSDFEFKIEIKGKDMGKGDNADNRHNGPDLGVQALSEDQSSNDRSIIAGTSSGIVDINQDTFNSVISGKYDCKAEDVNIKIKEELCIEEDDDVIYESFTSSSSVYQSLPNSDSETANEQISIKTENDEAESSDINTKCRRMQFFEKAIPSPNCNAVNDLELEAEHKNLSIPFLSCDENHQLKQEVLTAETDQQLGIEVDKIKEEPSVVKDEPEWSMFGYTQEPDTIFVSDSDDNKIIIDSDSDDANTLPSPHLRHTTFHDSEIMDPEYWDFSSPENFSSSDNEVHVKQSNTQIYQTKMSFSVENMGNQTLKQEMIETEDDPAVSDPKVYTTSTIPDSFDPYSVETQVSTNQTLTTRVKSILDATNTKLKPHLKYFHENGLESQSDKGSHESLYSQLFEANTQVDISGKDNSLASRNVNEDVYYKATQIISKGEGKDNKMLVSDANESIELLDESGSLSDSSWVDQADTQIQLYKQSPSCNQKRISAAGLQIRYLKDAFMARTLVAPPAEASTKIDNRPFDEVDNESEKDSDEIDAYATMTQIDARLSTSSISDNDLYEKGIFDSDNYLALTQKDAVICNSDSDNDQFYFAQTQVDTGSNIKPTQDDVLRKDIYEMETQVEKPIDIQGSSDNDSVTCNTKSNSIVIEQEYSKDGITKPSSESEQKERYDIEPNSKHFEVGPGSLSTDRNIETTNRLQNIKHKLKQSVQERKIIELPPQQMKSYHEKKMTKTVPSVQVSKSSYKIKNVSNENTTESIPLNTSNTLNKSNTSAKQSVISSDNKALYNPRQPDIWLSKNVSKSTNPPAAPIGKRKRRSTGETVAAASFKKKIEEARKQLADRNYQTIFHPESRADTQKKQKLDIPPAADLEDVDLPSCSQIVSKGLPILNPTDMLVKKNKPNQSSSSRVSSRASSHTDSTVESESPVPDPSSSAFEFLKKELNKQQRKRKPSSPVFDSDRKTSKSVCGSVQSNIGAPSQGSATEQSKNTAAVLGKETKDNPANVPKDKPIKGPNDKAISAPKDKSMNASKDKPANVPKDKSMNASKDKPANDPKDISKSVPKDKQADVPKDKSKNVPKDKSINVPKDNPINVPKDKSTNVPKDKQTNIPKDKSANIPKDKPTNVPTDKPINVPKDKPIIVPKDKPINIPKDKPVNLPQCKSDRKISNFESSNSEKMSEVTNKSNTSDKTSPGTKSKLAWNVASVDKTKRPEDGGTTKTTKKVTFSVNTLPAMKYSSGQEPGQSAISNPTILYQRQTQKGDKDPGVNPVNLMLKIPLQSSEVSKTAPGGATSHQYRVPLQPVQQQRQNQVPATTNLKCGASTQEKGVTFKEFLCVMLRWNPLWFEEHAKLMEKGETSQPPNCTNGLPGSPEIFPLPEKYSSFKEYCDIFMAPLLLYETWESCYQDLREKQKRKNMLKHQLVLTAMYDAGDKLNECVLLGMLTEGQKRQSPFFCEGDLVILSLFGVMLYENNQPGEPKMTDQMALVERVIYKDFDVNKLCSHNLELAKMKKPNSFSVKVILKVRRRKFNPDYKKLGNLTQVGSVVTTLRQFKALECLPKNPLCQDLLWPSNMETFCDYPTQYNIQNQGDYNPSQQKAIMTAALMVARPDHLPKICLLQGPPGTGKSHTILGIINQILKDKQQKARICLCAQSHAAIDEFLRRLIRQNKQFKQKDISTLKLVRIGKPSSVHEDVRYLCLEKLVEKNVKTELEAEKLKQLPKSLVTEKSALEKKIQAVRNEIKNSPELKKKKLTIDLEKLERQKGNLMKKCQINVSNAKTTAEHEWKVKCNLLENAHVIAGTLSGIGGSIMKLIEGSKRVKQGHWFDCIIIDEATQAVELDTLIPLQYGTTKLILVGDPEQLPPTVISQVATDNKLNMSLFERLNSHFRYSNYNPVIMLDTQYRMDPEICSFPSNYVYDGKLKTDKSIYSRSQCPLTPYLLYDIAEGREQLSQTSGSVCNVAEVLFTVRLVEFITSKTNVTTNVIGIIAPYQKQKSLLISHLQDSCLNGMHEIEVSTVDGFQGREKHVIIMSCVRAKSSTGTIGFVGNRNRMNVSLTRAKYALYVVAHFDSLEKSGEWKALIEDANKRRKRIPVNERNVEHALNRCLKRYQHPP